MCYGRFVYGARSIVYSRSGIIFGKIRIENLSVRCGRTDGNYDIITIIFDGVSLHLVIPRS